MQGNSRIYSSMGPKVFDMYKNAELYKNDKNYEPVSNIATIKDNDDPLSALKPTISLGQYESILSKMKKYFGTDDAFSIYIPAAEQECGSGKPSTKANDKVTE